MPFAPVKFYYKLAPVFFTAICVAVFGLNLQAQTRKAAPRKTVKETPAAKNKQAPAGKQTAASKQTSKSASSDKNKKPTKAELARDAERRREAAKREAERQQAILAEKRRREQIAREARERQMAFERGLRTETLENIAKDDTSGEDMEVRRAAISALGTHAGTVVVMESQTGKVLSIVNQDWAIRKGFKPCSTIKLVTGVAGLNEKLVDERGNLTERRFPMDLNDALAHSNNSYFQKIGTDLGNNQMISYAKELGLGERTGINAQNESAGRLPYGNNNPRIYSHGDDFEVTPLQLAVMVSALSNGGKKIVPHIPRTSVEKTNFQGVMRGEVNLPKDKLRGVLPGMIGAVNYGTARRSNGTEFSAAGKTGSCIGQGSWLGLFASVAPVVNPKYTVVVITRGQSERGKYASAIAGKIYKSLSHRFREPGSNRELIARVPNDLKPKPKVDAKTSALVDSGEGEDSDEGDVNVAGGRPDNARKAAAKKTDGNPSAKPSAGTKNLFPPVVISVDSPHTRPRIVPMKNQ
jgi:penicillin-binding protein 2